MRYSPYIDYTVQCHNVYVRFTMREFPLHKLPIRYNATMFTYDLQCGSSPYINWLYGTMVQCLRTIYHAWVPLAWIDYTGQWHNVYVRFTMREFPLHKLTIRYNAKMFTYDLRCGSSPYIKWLYGTMAQSLRTIYHLPCGRSPYINWHTVNCLLYNAYNDYTVHGCNVYVRFTMREFPLHKLTIRYNGTMFTYDLPCGSSPYINWLYDTMPRCLRTIYHAAVPLT